MYDTKFAWKMLIDFLEEFWKKKNECTVQLSK